MDAFIWDQRYMTGESMVDSEHQELVRIINQVVELQSKFTDEDRIRSVLDQLINYAGVHFGHEEELMTARGCDPQFIASHIKVHKDFAGHVLRMRDTRSSSNDMEHLLSFLTNWLAYHILGMDKAMARQIEKIGRGISPQQAFQEEKSQIADPSTSSMLDAMNSLYRIIAARNDALLELNQSLENQVSARTQALSESNKQLRIAAQQIEITQKKLLESEHKRAESTRRHLQLFLSQIIDGDPVPTLVIDAQHRITHWNRACATISELPAEEMIGTNKQWKAFYPSERPIMADLIVDGSLEEQFETYYQGLFRRSTTIPNAFEGENFFPDLGQNGRWLFFTAAPLLDINGKTIGAIETLQDVTERHRAEEELLRHQSQLEEQVASRTKELAEANARLAREQNELTQLLSKVEEAQQQLLQSEKMAAIGQLAAGVAHEINNPVGFVNSNLSTLKNYVGNLLDLIDAYEKLEVQGDTSRLEALRQRADLEFLREDLPALLNESQDGLDRVTRIVQDLKDFSRVDQAEQQLTDLNSAMNSTLNVVRNEIKYKADVVLELGDIPEVECVPAQVNQVFMNLLVNAAQAIEQQGKITVRSGATEQDVWFEIEDTGKGMTEEVRKRIFEPFYTTKPVGKGTGLGLSISYDIIVKKHAGRFDVRSQPGVGSCFRIWLPIKRKEA